MKLDKLDILVIFSVLAVVVFVGVPLLSISNPLAGDNTTDTDSIVDPTEEFRWIDEIQEAHYNGSWETEDTYYVIYTRNVESCNTYTLSEELTLIDEGNGLSKPSNAYTFETNEPTAVTCTLDPESVETSSESEEFLVLLLDYNRENGEYIEVNSVDELTEE